MELIICGSLSVLILVIILLCDVLWRKDIKKAIRINSVGVFILIFVALAPCHIEENGYSFGTNLFDTICVMITQSNLGESLGIIGAYDTPITGAYRVFLICLYILGPISVAGATLSFVKGFGKVIYRIKSCFRDSYIFSSVNERSFAVSQYVHKKNPQALILFAVGTDVSLEEKDVSRIEDLNGIVIRQNIKDVKHGLGHKRHYFLLDADAAKNIDTGLAINEKFADNRQAKTNVELLIYSNDEMSNIIFYNTPHYVTIHTFREEDIIANSLIFDFPLYGGVKDGKLDILIVGAGKIGYEIIKKVIWASYLGKNVKTQINVIDANAQAALSRLKKDCPALFDEAEIDINFYNADIANDSFTEVLDSFDKPTYIVVALGDEKLNAETCIYLRRHLGIDGGFPKIHMTTDTREYVDQLKLIEVFDYVVKSDRSFKKRRELGQNFEIKGFGSYESAYENVNPADSDLGILSLACHAEKINVSMQGTGGDRRCGEDISDYMDSLSYSYNQIFFYKNNADQLALSISYLLYAIGYQDVCAEYLEEVRKKLGLQSVFDIPYAAYVSEDYDFAAEIEKHLDELSEITTERYNRFMYTLGWTKMPLDEIKNQSTRDQLRMRYARIGKYDVEALEKIVNEGRAVAKDYRKNDLDEIRRLPAILYLAKSLSHK